jgi:hypothetical protein
VRRIGGPGNGEGQFNHPRGLAVDDVNLYVCDKDHHFVHVFEKHTGRFVGQLRTHRLRVQGTADGLGLCWRLAARFGGQGDGDANLNEPVGIAVGSICV